MQVVYRLLALNLLIGLTACGPGSCPSGQPEAAPSAPAAAETNARVYYVLGNVKELQPRQRKIIVEHEEIANFMDAMTMPFNVANTNELTSITTNDRIHFRLVVETDRSWIDQITKVGEVINITNVSRKDFRLVRDVEPLAVGDPLPDYPLTNQLGQAFHTADFTGKFLVITLIFTRCPLPDFCPRMSQNLGRVHRLLTNDPTVPANWHLLSISFDPEFDTPTVLASYARQYGADPKTWTFATGALIEIDDITERFGMFFASEAGGVTFNHNLRTVVIAPDGNIRKIFIGNSWEPEELVAVIKETAAPKAAVPEEITAKNQD